VVARPIGEGAAEKRQRGQAKLGGLLGPQQRLREKESDRDVSEDDAEFAQQRHHDDNAGRGVDTVERVTDTGGQPLATPHHAVPRQGHGKDCVDGGQ
jgi:hypothetical protein